MESLGGVMEEIKTGASQVIKEEGELSWQEAITQIGFKKPETEGPPLVASLAQSTENVNGTFSSFRLQAEVRQKTEQAQTQIKLDLERFRQKEKQTSQFKLRGEFVTIQDAIEQVEESMGEDTQEVRTEKRAVTEYDVAMERIKLISRKEKAKARRNPIRAAVRFFGDGLSALWTEGANRDSMTETAAMTQAAG